MSGHGDIDLVGVGINKAHALHQLMDLWGIKKMK